MVRKIVKLLGALALLGLVVGLVRAVTGKTVGERRVPAGLVWKVDRPPAPRAPRAIVEAQSSGSRAARFLLLVDT